MKTQIRPWFILLSLICIMGDSAAQAALRVVEIPAAAEQREISLRITDRLLLPNGADLSVWDFAILEIDQGNRTTVEFIRERERERSRVFLPVAPWNILVLPDLSAAHLEPDQTSIANNADLNSEQRAAIFFSRAKWFAARARFDLAEREFAGAITHAPQYRCLISLSFARAFEQFQDQKFRLARAQDAISHCKDQVQTKPTLWAASLIARAEVWMQLRDLSAAQADTNAVLHLTSDDLFSAQAHRQLAAIAMRNRDLVQAQTELDLSRTIIQQIAPNSIEAVLTEARQASLLMSQRELDATSIAYRSVIKKMQRLLPNNMALGRVYFNAHLHALERKLFDEAEQFARAARHIFSQAAPHSNEFFQANAALAEVFSQRAQFAEADALYLEAIAAAETLNLYSYESLSLHLQLGASLARQLNHTGALKHYDLVDVRLAHTDASVVRSNTNLLGDAMAYRATSLAQLEQCEPAIRVASAAQTTILARTSDNAANVLSLDLILADCQRQQRQFSLALQHAEKALLGFRKLGARGLQIAQAQFAIARIHRDLGATELAIQTYLIAIDAFEQHREWVGSDDQIRTQWANQYQAFYKEPMLLLAKLKRVNASLRLEHRYRAQALKKMLGESNSTQVEYRRFANSASDRLRLPQATAMVSFVVDTKQILVFLRQADSDLNRLFILPINKEKLLRDLDRLLLLYSKPHLDRRSDLAAANLAHQLYLQLLRPLEPELKNDQRWIMIADGPLLSLPWGALVSDLTPARRYVVEDHTIVQAPSSDVWHKLSLQQSQARSILAFADPEPAKINSEDQNEPVRLIGARKEIAALAQLYPNTTEQFIGPEANEGNVRARIQSAKLLHFAVHSVIDPQRPMASHLVLTSNQTQHAKDDGRLYAHEIAQELKLNIDLVVMSSCASARGGDGGGEGLLGLTSALHLAGARAVIATNWAVADLATATLMADFHQAHQAGSDSATAIAFAQRQWLSRARNTSWSSTIARRLGWAPALPNSPTSPFYWAGFMHSGASTN